MEIITTGTKRIVILTKRHAIKIPKFTSEKSDFFGRVIHILEGWRSNRLEYIWSKSDILNYFCEVKFSFFFSFVIIMDKTEMLTEKEFKELEPFNFGGYEHKIDSFGKIDGKVKIIDYGD